MKSNFDGLEIIYLHPGEIVFSKRPVIVSTLLGSCLSIVMYNRSKKFSAISHCQLPKRRDSGNSSLSCTEPYKYVDCTVIKMVEAFGKMNIPANEIEIKVFGGADVLENPSLPKTENSVGSQNIKTAIKMFNKFNLKIMASDTGGKKGRKLFFHTGTGEVFLNRLNNNEKNKSINS